MERAIKKEGKEVILKMKQRKLRVIILLAAIEKRPMFFFILESVFRFTNIIFKKCTLCKLKYKRFILEKNANQIR